MNMKRLLSFMLAVTAAFVLTSKANAYEVKFAAMQHCTYSALLNGSDFEGGEVNVYDNLIVVFSANPGWRFGDNDSKTLYFSATLYSSYFDSEGVYTVIEPYLYSKDNLVFDAIQILDESSARIRWKDDDNDFTAFRLWVSGEKLTGNPDYWKNPMYTTSLSYDVDNLALGQTYYVYLQGGNAAGYTSEIVNTTFATHEINPCRYTINMTDRCGDGWDGGSGLRVVENGEETFITLLSGSKGTETYVAKGGEVQVFWFAGTCCASEIGFTILNDAGEVLMEVQEDEADDIPDGQMLFSGTLCPFSFCNANVSNVNWTANEAGTQYTVTWDAVNAVSYEVAVLQKTTPTPRDLDAAAVAVTDKTYTFTGKDHGIYDVYVRGICADGIKGTWSSPVRMCNPMPGLNDSIIKANAQTITLDYVESGDMMEGAVALGSGSTLFPCRFYHLTLTDSTDVTFFFNSRDIYEYVFIIYQDTLTGKPLAQIKAFSGGELKLKGDFYIGFETNQQFGEYALKIHAPQELSVTTVDKLDFSADGNFVDAVEMELPGMLGGKMALCKAFRYTPADSTKVLVQLTSTGSYYGVAWFLYRHEVKNGNCIMSYSSGSIWTGDLAKDTTYYFVLVSVPYYGGLATDTYSFSIKELHVTPTPTPTQLITLDAIFEDSFNKNNIVNEYGMNGKVYEFVLTDETRISYSIKLLGEHAEDPQWFNNVRMEIYADTIVLGEYEAYSMPSWSYLDYMTFYGNASGRHYFVVVYNQDGTDAQYRVNLRVDQGRRPDNLTIKSTIQVGDYIRSEISAADPYSYEAGVLDYSYGAIEAYKVALEKDKTYKVFMHRLPDESTNLWYGGFQVTVLDPKVKTGDFWNHILVSKDYLEDEDWEIVTFTADTTADYTIIFGAGVDKGSLEEYLTYEFKVSEVTDLLGLSDGAPVVRDNYVVSGTFEKNVKVGPKPEYNFHADPQSWTEEYGAFDAVVCVIKVAKGDTLFAEFGGDEDGMIHIFDTYGSFSPTNPLIINEHPYSYPYEKGFIVNEFDVDTVDYVVFGSFVNVSVKNGQYTLRVATSSQALAPVVVTPKVDKTTITIHKSDGVAIAQTELGKLVLTAVPQNGGDVLNLTNNPFEWAIDLDANIARYTFNDADLPMGYVFAGTNPSVEVTIKRIPDGIEEVEEDATVESAVTARKVMINGHILIITPNGTFDMFGRKVE